MARAILLLPLLTLLCSSCTWVTENANVMVTSDPSGAEILLDGMPTGSSTPTMLTIEEEAATHTITLRKSGFEDESRTIYHYAVGSTSRWDDGAIDTTLLNWPIWWTLGDFLTPFAIRYLYVPHDVMVRLYPEGEAPMRASEPPDPLTGNQASPRR